MEIRIAPFTVVFGGRKKKYYVMYPLDPPVGGPVLMVLDSKGTPLRVADAYASRRSRIVAAAFAAIRLGVSQPLGKLRSVPSPAALELAENVGWLTRCELTSSGVLLPSTPVFFRDGLPADLREQAGGDVRRALQLLADCVRQGVAEPISPKGEVVTAAELAAAGG
jgi:hypothetical protein